MTKNDANKITIACYGGCGRTVTLRKSKVSPADYYLCNSRESGKECKSKLPPAPPGMICIVEMNAAGAFCGYSYREPTYHEALSLAHSQIIQDAKQEDENQFSVNVTLSTQANKHRQPRPMATQAMILRILRGYVATRKILAQDAFESEEYMRRLGYVFAWAGESIKGSHVIISGMQIEWALRQEHMPESNTVSDAHAAKDFFAWLSVLPTVDNYDPLPQETLLAIDELYRRGVPGTESWRWQGIMWIANCPALKGESVFSAAILLPPHELLAAPNILEVTQLLATIFHAAHL